MQFSTTTLIIAGIVIFFAGYLLGKKSSHNSGARMPEMPKQSLPQMPMSSQGARLSKKDIEAQINHLLQLSQKIEAIKFLRQERPLGLKEAKDYVEALEQGYPPPLDIGD